MKSDKLRDISRASIANQQVKKTKADEIRESRARIEAAYKASRARKKATAKPKPAPKQEDMGSTLKRSYKSFKEALGGK